MPVDDTMVPIRQAGSPNAVARAMIAWADAGNHENQSNPIEDAIFPHARPAQVAQSPEK